MGYTSYSLENRSMNTIANGYATKSVNEIFLQSKERRVHESMDSTKIITRECLDSDNHPNTIPIILALDVTGSMGIIPHELIKEGLPKLMGKMIQNGIEDASLMFVGVGDHEYDRHPFQAGQFESGDEELDMWLTRTYLEGGGGGNAGESYMLPWYFAIHHVKTDAFSKRGKKGFLFTIGDEPLLPNLPKSAVAEIFTSTSQTNLKSDDLYTAASEKFNVFHIAIGDRGLSKWKELLGQNCITITRDDYEKIPSIIADIVLQNSTLETSINTVLVNPTEPIKIIL